jgi:hypothetical protein
MFGYRRIIRSNRLEPAAAEQVSVSGRLQPLPPSPGYTLCCLAVVLSLLPTAASARDGISLAVGSEPGADSVQAAYELGWPGTLWRGKLLDLRGYAEFGAAYWSADQYDNGRVDLGDFSATAVLRLSHPVSPTIAFYAEGGIGLHYLTRSVLNPDVELSTRFQFGDLFGLGIAFGAHRQFDVGVRYLHVSNGGIRDPNGGADLIVGRFTYWF